MPPRSAGIAPQIVVPAQIVVGDNLCKILQNLTPQIVVVDNLCCSCRSQFLISQTTICAGNMKPNCTNCRLHKLTSVSRCLQTFKLQKIMTITKMMMMMMTTICGCICVGVYVVCVCVWVGHGVCVWGVCGCVCVCVCVRGGG